MRLRDSPGNSPSRFMDSDKRAKWAGLVAHPEWLRDAEKNVLKILLVDACWDWDLYDDCV